jgi:hypothetical protein
MKKFAVAALLALGVVALVSPQAAWAQDDKMFTIHGEVRARAEYQNNTFDFTDQDANSVFDSDDGAFFFPYRIRIAAEGRFSDTVSAWIEFQNTGVFGGDNDGPRKTGFSDPYGIIGNGDSAVELYQGYVTLGELWSKHFSLRIGRQEIVLGNEFIMGDEDFYGGISHDGIAGMWDYDKVDFTAWYTRAFEDSVSNFKGDLTPDIPFAGYYYAFINGDAENHEQFGGYATFGVGKDQVVDVYLVNNNDRGTGGRYQTVGGRYARDGWDKKGFIWNVEIAQQFGSVASELISGADVDASGMGAEGWFGFQFGGGNNVHRVYGRLEYATGNEDDDDVTTLDDEYEGFLGLYGEFHNRAGRGDWFRVQGDDTTYGAGTTFLGTQFVDSGLMALSVGYTGHFGEKHEIGAAFWDYQAEQEVDVLSPGAPATADFQDDLGSAFDVWYGFNYSKNVAFEASYSNLSPGDALTSDGVAATSDPDDSVERFYGQIRLRF